MSLDQSKTDSAVLRGDRLEWLGEPPVETTDDGAVRVEVKFLVPEPVASSDGELMADSLRRLRNMSAFAEIDDPIA